MHKVECWQSSLSGSRERDWLEFIKTQPDASPYHHPEWLRLLEKVYRWQPTHLTVRQEGKIVGGLPAFLTQTLLGKKRLRALPFSHLVPPLAASPEVERAIMEGLQAWAVSLGAQRAYLNAPCTVHGWQSLPGRWHSILKLNKVREKEKKAPTGSTGRNVRTAIRAGLTIRMASAPADFRQFARLMCLTRKRQGTPPYPAKLYAEMPGLRNIRLYVAEKGTEALAGIVILAWGGKAVYLYGASSENGFALRANDLLFHSVIQILAEEGLETLDFGTTPEWKPELLRFKNKWGCDSRRLDYSVWNASGSSSRHAERDPRNTAMGKMAVSCLRKTPPFALQWIGNRFFRYLG